LLALNLADSLLNSAWILPMTAAAGGLNGWSSRRDRERASDPVGSRWHGTGRGGSRARATGV
jgi:hypothetical protein